MNTPPIKIENNLLQQDKEICEFMLRIEKDQDRRNAIQIRLNEINREL